jgi:hypothetical protein
MIVHGQTHGGIAQGVGQALWEQCYIDPSSGQPLTGSFMDYGMPHAHTLPSFKTEIVEVLSPTNPLGIKAGGEGGTTPALAVIVSGIVDALRDYGIRDIQMPATPYTIWQASGTRNEMGKTSMPGARKAAAIRPWMPGPHQPETMTHRTMLVVWACCCRCSWGSLDTRSSRAHCRPSAASSATCESAPI